MEFRKKEYAPFDIFDSEYFTVSFFAPEYKKALAYLGSHSGNKRLL